MECGFGSFIYKLINLQIHQLNERFNMRAPHEIATDLKSLLETSFQTVLVTTARVSGQFLAEAGAIPAAKLPAVIVAYERFGLTRENTVDETQLSLVLVDSPAVGDEAKAMSLLTALSTLRGLFPAGGRTINGVFYLPTDGAAAGVDNLYACFALNLTAKQSAM